MFNEKIFAYLPILMRLFLLYSYIFIFHVLIVINVGNFSFNAGDRVLYNIFTLFHFEE